MNIEKKIELILPYLIRNNSEKFESGEVTIKFSGDGTNICRNIKLLNSTFTVINEGQKAKTALGNYTIGIFDIDTENYEELLRLLKDLALQIDNLSNTLEIDGKAYTIKKKFGGDWMFLSAMLGINGPTSNYPCIYCKWFNGNSSNSFRNNKTRDNLPQASLANEWSITDTKKHARTIKEAIDLSSQNIRTNGYINMPIVKSIEIHDYVFCTLHLFLRISDKLENLFFSDLEEIDYLNKTKNQLKYLDYSIAFLVMSL